MEHKFRTGQKVHVEGNIRFLAQSSLVYEIVRALPESNGEYSYRIKSNDEAHERVVKESQLSEA